MTGPADDAAGLFTRATEVFDDRVRQVRPDRWAAPTPCDDWDVRELVNHVTVEDLWAPALLSYGDESAAQYLMQLFTDHLVHAWDLAQATGGDPRLPDDLVEACASWFAEVEALYRAAGVIGPATPAPPDADAQTRLLGAFGRDGAASPIVVDDGAGEGP